MAVINGTSGDNEIDTSGNGSEADVVNGLGGNDSIVTGNGGDTVDAGEGDDTVVTGGGSDTVVAGAGDDTVSGGANQDNIEGKTGEDILDGDSSNDEVRGGKGNDYVAGGGGNDTLFGGKGSDFILGGSGDDVLYAVNEDHKDSDIDYFGFDADDGSDTVIGFNKSTDKIFLYGDDTASLSYNAGTGDTTMTYGSTTVTFKGVNLTTVNSATLFATEAEVGAWGEANFDDADTAL